MADSEPDTISRKSKLAAMEIFHALYPDMHEDTDDAVWDSLDEVDNSMLALMMFRDFRYKDDRKHQNRLLKKLFNYILAGWELCEEINPNPHEASEAQNLLGKMLFVFITLLSKRRSLGFIESKI